VDLFRTERLSAAAEESSIGLSHFARLGAQRMNRVHSRPTPGIVIFVLAATALTWGCSEHPGSVPRRLNVEDQVTEMAPILLSELFDGEPVVATFPVCNNGGGTMAVRLVDKSCGCESIEVPEGEVPPGETAIIRMVLHPQPKAESKAYRATVRLSWAERHQLVKLSTALTVMPEVSVQPPEVLGDFASEDHCERQLTVLQRVRSKTEPQPIAPQLNDLPDEVEVLAMEYLALRNTTEALRRESSHQSMRNPEHSQDATNEGAEKFRPPMWEIEWRAILRLKPTERIRDGFTGQFALVAGGVGSPALQIPIRLRCIESIQLTPPYTYFGRAKPGEERKRTVLVRALDDDDFEVIDVSSDSPTFAGLVGNSVPKKLHRLQVVFRSSEGGEHTGTIRVATTHPRCPTVSFGVEGSVEPKGDTETVAAASDLRH
jgi:hypothetical protein